MPETRIEVEKDFDSVLAKRFSHLACQEDFPFEGIIEFGKNEKKLIEMMLEVNSSSEVDTRVVLLQRLKLLGIKLTPEQEKIINVVLITEIVAIRKNLEATLALAALILSPIEKRNTT